MVSQPAGDKSLHAPMLTQFIAVPGFKMLIRHFEVLYIYIWFKNLHNPPINRPNMAYTSLDKMHLYVVLNVQLSTVGWCELVPKCISYYNHGYMWEVTIHACLKILRLFQYRTIVDVGSLVDNYTPLIHVDVINNPCYKFYVDFANLCCKRRSVGL